MNIKDKYPNINEMIKKYHVVNREWIENLIEQYEKICEDSQMNLPDKNVDIK